MLFYRRILGEETELLPSDSEVIDCNNEGFARKMFMFYLLLLQYDLGIN